MSRIWRIGAWSTLWWSAVAAAQPVLLPLPPMLDAEGLAEPDAGDDPGKDGERAVGERDRPGADLRDRPRARPSSPTRGARRRRRAALPGAVRERASAIGTVMLEAVHGETYRGFGILVDAEHLLTTLQLVEDTVSGEVVFGGGRRAEVLGVVAVDLERGLAVVASMTP